MAEEEIQIDVDIPAQELILAASKHDIPTLKTHLKTTSANVQDPDSLFTPLHAAIAACALDEGDEEESAPELVDAATTQNGEETKPAGLSKEELDAVKETVQILLENGAIWNDLDKNDETPGCIAHKLGLEELYEMMVNAGVRAELLLSRLDEYQQLGDEEVDENPDVGEQLLDESEKSEKPGEQVNGGTDDTTQSQGESSEPAPLQQPEPEQPSLPSPDAADSNPAYLSSSLSFTSSSILDSSTNAVMMSWESTLMTTTAKNLLPTPGLRVLNIGFGMGIIDTAFQSHAPTAHHIIEAHPSVLERLHSSGWSSKPGVVIHAGRWQDILPALLASPDPPTFDAIYFDTFAESYADLRRFFSEYVIGLLDADGKWSFFNGMGADRRISYDVYQRIVEIDLFEAGFEVQWGDVEIGDLEAGGDWEGVKRKYWVLDRYRMPICKFLG
ncbi:MAG: Arginine N-methyltransferase 2 [Cirrosporium novae-zelandiae]|nr:MAG: Arginine N-methyltransferase 2 [Cirrosporium novae-zelandiae]